MEKTVITLYSRVVVSNDQVSCDLAGEAAILNLKNGVYYGLDPVGARIWNLIQNPVAVAEVRDAILAEFEVTADKAESDLLALLEKLDAEGLLQVTHEAAA